MSRLPAPGKLTESTLSIRKRCSMLDRLAQRYAVSGVFVLGLLMVIGDHCPPISVELTKF